VSDTVVHNLKLKKRAKRGVEAVRRGWWI